VLNGFRAERIIRAEVLDAPDGADRHVSNASGDERVRLRPLPGVDVLDGGVKLSLPALSWAVVELDVAV
jgi:alpha-N-arabinofuranosidase